MKNIVLDFIDFKISAQLFDSHIAGRFLENLPVKINLTLWGNEAYGPIENDLGSNMTVSHIPPGGLAFTNQGNYFCIFFGQEPAWPVEYIGKINGDDWKKLLNKKLERVIITAEN